MTLVFKIPRIGKEELEIPVYIGDVIFVLGANGCGKSSLLQQLFSKHHSVSRRISAHRQTWMASNAISLSPSEKRTADNRIKNSDAQPNARFKDEHANQRAGIAIYDLIDAENVRARHIASFVDSGTLDKAQSAARRVAPIAQINELLALANLPISISVIENEQLMASKSGCAPYSIAELSDGERNAILIAATVMTVKPSTIIFIDEPERHLHRSIVSPLLTALFKKRTDCEFVISTHEVSLATDYTKSKSLLVRTCLYNKGIASAWDVDLLPIGAMPDEMLKRDILGARRKIIFVEGEAKSLDIAIYKLLFSTASVVYKSSCKDVEAAVAGTKAASALHWLQVAGIIDNDQRSAAEILQFKQSNIFVLPVYSVESIYYHPDFQFEMARIIASAVGANPLAAVTKAKTQALAKIDNQIAHLSERTAERSIREQVFSNLPRRRDLKLLNKINIEIDARALIDNARYTLEGLIESKNLEKLISSYPIRETGALAVIASSLGYQDQSQYESAVLNFVRTDAKAQSILNRILGNFIDDVNSAE